MGSGGGQRPTLEIISFHIYLDLKEENRFAFYLKCADKELG